MGRDGEGVAEETGDRAGALGSEEGIGLSSSFMLHEYSNLTSLKFLGKALK